MDLPMSATFRLNLTALSTIRLGLNELSYRYENDKDSKNLVHRAKELRDLLYITERHLLDTERNMVRSNWGGKPIYTIPRRTKDWKC